MAARPRFDCWVSNVFFGKDKTVTATVNVQTDGGDYPILINAGNWDDLAAKIRPMTSTAIVATDSHVCPLYANDVVTALETQGVKVVRLQCEAGETAKSVAVVSDWWRTLAAARVDRQAVLVAVGGGVVGDLAGFVAASHLRGLRFVQVPTTLLAQVDSSVGGKVGINLPQGKNLVGSFWQPELVWIDTNVLLTLTDREYAAGLAEVVKYAVIADAELFDWLKENAVAIRERKAEVTSRLIQRCCQIKADVVQEDTRETSGRRAILNFGHTVGHAIEQLSGYGHFLHGEAVAMGMVSEAEIACRRELCTAELVSELTALLKIFQLPTAMPSLKYDALLDCMRGDKKNQNGNIVFVLPDRMGQVSLRRDIELNPEDFQ